MKKQTTFTLNQLYNFENIYFINVIQIRKLSNFAKIKS